MSFVIVLLYFFGEFCNQPSVHTLHIKSSKIFPNYQYQCLSLVGQICCLIRQVHLLIALHSHTCSCANDARQLNLNGLFFMLVLNIISFYNLNFKFNDPHFKLRDKNDQMFVVKVCRTLCFQNKLAPGPAVGANS